MNLTLIIHIALSVLLLAMVNFLGGLSKVFGYQNAGEMMKNNVGFNIFFRVLSPAVFIAVLSVLFYELSLDSFVRNIWIISVFYCSFNFIALFLLDRLRFVNKKLLFFTYLSTIAISYFVYQYSLIRGSEYILPDEGNFRTEIWIIIILFFYKLLDSYSPSYEKQEIEKKNKIRVLYNNLLSKYGPYISPEFKKNKSLRDTLMSLMIMEDINRPKYVRSLEKVLFFTKLIKTTGIMQIKSDVKLSDRKSIKLAEDLILNVHNRLPEESLFTLPGEVANVYNGGRYANGMYEIYYIVSSYN